MALTSSGKKALRSYIARAQATGQPEKLNIAGAVKLTQTQRTELQQILVQLWKNPNYLCPAILPIKPQHGYKSRVFKDGFPADQFGVWLEFGCSDLAAVGEDSSGRPRLTLGPRRDYPNHEYNLVVPIRSDFHGSVYVDDVIPQGLPAGTKK